MACLGEREHCRRYLKLTLGWQRWHDGRVLVMGWVGFWHQRFEIYFRRVATRWFLYLTVLVGEYRGIMSERKPEY